MIVVGLLAYAMALSVLAPRALSRAWTLQHPSAGLLAWHVVVSTVMVSVVLAGFVAAHDIWEPIATFAFRAEPEAVHHQYAGTATVGHGWNLAVIIVGLLFIRLAVVAAVRRRRLRIDRDELRSAVHALRPRRRTGPRDDVVVVALREPTAFCVPGRAAMVVVSESAVKSLSADQLGAVVAHEWAHLTHRHAASAAWAVAVAVAFPMWPLARKYASTVPRLNEMQADDIAAKATDGRVVASSLLALSGSNASGSLSMAGGHVHERGLRLLIPAKVHRGALGCVCVGIAAVAILPTLLVAGPGLAVAGSDHHPEISHGLSILHP